MSRKQIRFAVLLNSYVAAVAFAHAALACRLFAAALPGPEQEMRCGPNALYVFLRMHGHDVTIDDVNNALPYSPLGHTVLALQGAALTCGAEVRIVRTDTSADLLSASLPLILHRANAPGRPGHFMVIWRASPDGRFNLIDGTTSEHLTNSVDQMVADNRWTGIAIEHVKASPIAPFRLIAPAALLISLVAIARAIYRLFPLRRRAIRTCAAFFFLASCGAGHALIASTFTTSENDTDLKWRTPHNDAINCLSLLLRLYGRPCQYQEVTRSLRDAGSPVSMAVIDKCAGALGLPLTLFAPTTKELEEHIPGIVILQSGRSHAGGFFVLLSRRSPNVTVFSGATAEWIQLSEDTFLQSWTGHILSCVDNNENAGLARRSMLTIVLVGLSAYVFFRTRMFR
jgi:ABC-type bacteriocin/lantibiotic exporter with double-glycine peptidase domain